MASSIDSILKRVFSNGIGEAGLEVGVDPGLPESHYIQVPASMRKTWVARLDDPLDYVRRTVPGAKDTTADMLTTVPAWDVARGPSDYVGRPGWVHSGSITIHEGSMFITGTLTGEFGDDKAGDTELFELMEFHADPPTKDDVENFYIANIGHIPETIIDPETIKWVHATRFWCTTSGFVAGGKSPEFVQVPNPDKSTPPPDLEEVAKFISTFGSNAWTAAAARATSWRKSNHATGGDRVSGFPRRWLAKMGYLVTQADKSRQLAHEREVTTAFYAATHAAQVHPVLALMAPSDVNHWAELDPCYGLISQWDVKASTQLRMVPNTQVAGAAMVVDSIVALKIMVKEGIAPLLANAGQIGSLIAAYRVVETDGVKVASYARWFLEGHPEGARPTEFNQKDPAYAELVGELAVVATKYYAGSTISNSAALANAVDQLADDTAKTHWAALAKDKKAVSATQLADAYSRVKGGASRKYIADLLSEDRVVAAGAVQDYNAKTSEYASLLDISGATILEFDSIFKPGTEPTI